MFYYSYGWGGVVIFAFVILCCLFGFRRRRRYSDEFLPTTTTTTTFPAGPLQQGGGIYNVNNGMYSYPAPPGYPVPHYAQATFVPGYPAPSTAAQGSIPLSTVTVGGSKPAASPYPSGGPVNPYPTSGPQGDTSSTPSASAYPAAPANPYPVPAGSAGPSVPTRQQPQQVPLPSYKSADPPKPVVTKIDDVE